MSEYDVILRAEERFVVEIAQPDRDIRIMRGDSLSMKVRVSTDEGAYLNMVGASVDMTVKKELSDDDLDAVISKSVGSGITLLESANGYFEVVLTGDDTKDLDDGVYYYDVQVTLDSTEVYTVMVGKLYLKPDVTIG